ncbi:septum formation family protein [Oerskovia flava]|uniref:septum formation family protein n=1 Tax=Oerskovia flava TaxID=2986422 RepID=UPI0022409AC1|nr:septum formation family protein [Oerskovia sp. JB1-3-2]
MNPSSAARRSVTTLVASLAAVALLSGCGAIQNALGGAADAQRDEPGGQITAASQADVFSLQVGDCLDQSAESAGEIESLPVVPCSDPHDGEIYAELELPAGDFPGADAVNARADEFCIAEFEPFVGVAYEDSELYFWSMTPLEAGWQALDDRVVQCVLDTAPELVTGSLAGSGR